MSEGMVFNPVYGVSISWLIEAGEVSCEVFLKSLGKAMIAVDTNLQVRLLNNDDPEALRLALSAKASRFATFDRDFGKKV